MLSCLFSAAIASGLLCSASLQLFHHPSPSPQSNGTQCVCVVCERLSKIKLATVPLCPPVFHMMQTNTTEQRVLRNTTLYIARLLCNNCALCSALSPSPPPSPSVISPLTSLVMSMQSFFSSSLFAAAFLPLPSSLSPLLSSPLTNVVVVMSFA